MNKQMKIAIFAIIALGSIGFAAITISLRQNGTATISGIESNFTNNIQFETVYADEQSKTDGATVSITPDRKSFTFTTQTLTTTQDSFQINYNIRNKPFYRLPSGIHVDVYNEKDSMFKRRSKKRYGNYHVVDYKGGLYNVNDGDNDDIWVPRYMLAPRIR